MNPNQPRPDRHAAARVLALMVAANGRADPRELQALQALDACTRLGLSQAEFLAMVNDSLQDIGGGLAECSWLRSCDQAHLDHLLDAVHDRDERLLVCRLAAAVVTADGQISGDERLVFDYALARWHISRSMLTDAILHDPVPPRTSSPQHVVLQ